MKKYILLLPLSLLFAVSVQAQKMNGPIHISGLKIEEAGDNISVTFQVDIPRKMIGSPYTMVYSPVVTDGNFQASLTPVIVEGRKAAHIRKRRELAAGESYYYDNAIYARTGERVDYAASIPAQRWMKGADLNLESVLFGCCSVLRSDSKRLAQSLEVTTDYVEYVTIMPEVREEV